MVKATKKHRKAGIEIGTGIEVTERWGKLDPNPSLTRSLR